MEEIKKILVDYLKYKLDTNCDWYHWEINEELLPKNIQLPKGNNIIKNISLKEQLHNRWKAEKDENIKGDLIEYYIVKWGGIRGNGKESLLLYKTKTSEELINLGQKGVASWSKALVLHDFNKYAIFDARVSCSLNYLQINYNTEEKILFPILQSQNNKIKIANKRLKEISKNWTKIEKDKFYKFYIQLLLELAEELKTNISMIEMLLFAKATEIIENKN